MMNSGNNIVELQSTVKLWNLKYLGYEIGWNKMFGFEQFYYNYYNATLSKLIKHDYTVVFSFID